jgi:hypothetical protein
MVELSREAYKILKSIDPSVIDISPSATSRDRGVAWLDEYLANGGGNYIDVVGFHFYTAPRPPELMLDFINKVKKTMLRHNVGGKPLWNTESGWLIANRLTNVKLK